MHAFLLMYAMLQTNRGQRCGGFRVWMSLRLEQSLSDCLMSVFVWMCFLCTLHLGFYYRTPSSNPYLNLKDNCNKMRMQERTLVLRGAHFCGTISGIQPEPMRQQHVGESVSHDITELQIRELWKRLSSSSCWGSLKGNELPTTGG